MKKTNFENLKGIADLLQALSIIISLFLIGFGIYLLVSGGGLGGIIDIVLGFIVYGLFYLVMKLTKELDVLRDRVDELEQKATKPVEEKKS